MKEKFITSEIKRNNKFKIIVSIITTLLIISAILILLSTCEKDMSGYYNGQLVTKIEVIDEINIHDMKSYELSDYKVRLFLKNKTTADIDLDETFVDAPDLTAFKNSLSKRIEGHQTLIIKCYKQSSIYSPYLYKTPIAKDIYRENGIDFIDFGMYPQGLLSNREIIDKLDTLDSNESGYKIYKGGAYVRVQAKEEYTNVNYKFANGEKIYNRVIIDSADYRNRNNMSWSLTKDITGPQYDVFYYFKYEPIKWRILKNDNDEYSLLSHFLLNNGSYDNKATIINQYDISAIRTDLNHNFLNSAFLSQVRDLIKETLVDNTGTSEMPDNPYECEDTFDKIYLLSFSDYINESYQFQSNKDLMQTGAKLSESRIAYFTDFAKLNCVHMSENPDSYGAGRYWTRSPSPFGSTSDIPVDDWAFVVNNDGSIENLHCISTAGYRPGLTIKVS